MGHYWGECPSRVALKKSHFSTKQLIVALNGENTVYDKKKEDISPWQWADLPLRHTKAQIRCPLCALCALYSGDMMLNIRPDTTMAPLIQIFYIWHFFMKSKLGYYHPTQADRQEYTNWIMPELLK